MRQDDSGFEILADRAFVTLAESVRDYALIRLDPEGVITHWGAGAHLLHGWTPGEAEGRHVRLLYPDGRAEDGRPSEHLATAREEGEHAGEGRRAREDGSSFWARSTLTHLREVGGMSLGFALAVRDHSPVRAAEAELRAKLEEALAGRMAAEEANRAKSELLTVISHEIRTPLNGLLGYLDLLQSEVGGPVSAAQQSFIERARRSGKHLLGLIEEILDLSLLEAGRVAVDRRVRRLGDPLGGALSLVEPQARDKRISLRKALPAETAKLTYWGHEQRVRQIIVNLLSNAVKFTEPGGRITLSAGETKRAPRESVLEGEGPWVHVRVEDTGEGIEPDRLSEIFEPFVQGEVGRPVRERGFGLGLAISRRLARLMDGDITARSTPGTGSTFTLWLPAAPPSAEPEAPDEVGDEAMLELEGAHETPDAVRSLRGAGDAILKELERTLSAFVEQLRRDERVPSAAAQDESVLEDHIATFLADVAQSLVAMDPESGMTGEDVVDSADIQELIAIRHGKQRARLGWSEAELRREYELLREALEAAVRRRILPHADPDVERIWSALRDFLIRAETESIAGFREGTAPRDESPER